MSVNCTSGYHFQITEYQIKRKKNSERSQRERHLTYRGTQMKITFNFSPETM